MFNTIKQTTQPELTRIDCYKTYTTSTQADFTFWVPTTSLDELGYISGDLLRTRIKHSLGINQGAFTFQAG